MTAAEQARELLQEVGLEAAGSTIEIKGSDPYLPSRFPLGTIAAQAVPGFGTADDYESYVENPAWQTAYGFEDSLETESSQVSLGIVWELDDYTLNSLTGYTDFSYDQIHDTDFHGVNAANNIDSEDLEQFSQEFRVSSNYDGRFNFVAGAYYEEQELDIVSAPLLDGTVGGVFGQLPAAALNPGLPAGLTLSDLGINSLWNGAVLAAQNPAVGGPLVGAEQEGIGRTAINEFSNETWSVFLELTYDITDTLSLELGARYADDTKDNDKSANILAGIPAAPIVVQNPDGSFTVNWMHRTVRWSPPGWRLASIPLCTMYP